MFLQDAIINLDTFEHSKNSTLNLNTNKKIINEEDLQNKKIFNI